MNQWFGLTKTKWNVVPLREYALIGTGHTPSRDNDKFWENCNIPWVTVEDLRNNGIDSLKPISDTCQKISELGLANSAAVLHPKGTVMLSRTASIGFSCVIDAEMATTQAFVTWTPHKELLNSNYLNAALMAMRDHYFALAYGATHLTIYFPDLKGLKIPLPPLADQQKIAKFLDYETSKIDKLIAKQQQLIALLKEKRQAVISHAVTKGLNPNAPMRDSCVEWLGEVPAHWNITKIKYIAELTPKKTEVEKFKHKTCNFVPMEKLKTDSLILDEVRLIEEVFDGYAYFKNEDVLMAKVTPCFENKNMVVARGLENGIGFGSSEIYVLRVKMHFMNDFLYYRLQEDVFIDLATGAMTGAGGLKRVPSDFVNNFEFALPPESERKDIVDYIRVYSLRFDSLISKAENAIELMQERRTALISAAVTGKIDVRDWQAPESLVLVEQQVSA